MNSFYGAISVSEGFLYPDPAVQNELLKSEDFIIIGDLRLDNRADLVSMLGLSRDIADSEIIQEAYKKWSEACLERLLGDFAFVIWDRKCKKVFCARDHIGVRPFFYCYNKSIFAFASEKKLLFSAPGFEKKANYKRISEILSYGVIGTLEYSNETEYENVFQLTPSHSLTIKSGNLIIRKYWDLSVRENLGKLSLDDAVDGLRSHLDQAVRCRLPSVGNVGFELSGGLDSSMVTAMAHKYRPDLHIFCSYIDKHNEVFLNERPYVEMLCDYLGIKNRHFVSSEGFEFKKELERCVRAIDGFGYGLGNLFKAPLIEKAQEIKCDVVFSGFGGDECVSYSGSNVSQGKGSKRDLNLFCKYLRLLF
jgi:asparagine synthase (glutamine-hydrolysing)